MKKHMVGIGIILLRFILPTHNRTFVTISLEVRTQFRATACIIYYVIYHSVADIAFVRIIQYDQSNRRNVLY